MTNSLIIVIALVLSNFIVFSMLVIMLLRARNRYAGSSYRITSTGNIVDAPDILQDNSEAPEFLEPQIPDLHLPVTTGQEKETEAVCCGKCASHPSHVREEVPVA